MRQTASQSVRRFVTAGAALCCAVLTACNATMPRRLTLVATGDKTAAGTFEFFATDQCGIASATR